MYVGFLYELMYNFLLSTIPWTIFFFNANQFPILNHNNYYNIIMEHYALDTILIRNIYTVYIF